MKSAVSRPAVRRNPTSDARLYIQRYFEGPVYRSLAVVSSVGRGLRAAWKFGTNGPKRDDGTLRVYFSAMMVDSGSLGDGVIMHGLVDDAGEIGWDQVQRIRERKIADVSEESALELFGDALDRLIELDGQMLAPLPYPESYALSDWEFASPAKLARELR